MADPKQNVSGRLDVTLMAPGKKNGCHFFVFFYFVFFCNIFFGKIFFLLFEDTFNGGGLISGWANIVAHAGKFTLRTHIDHRQAMLEVKHHVPRAPETTR